MASQSSIVLLNRLISLKENSPFLLVLDSLSQSSYYLVREFANKCSNDIIYLSYETLNKPSFATEFLDCTKILTNDIVKFVQSVVPASGSIIIANKVLLIIDSLNYIPDEQLTKFISSIISPNITILGIFHTDIPQAQSNVLNYPSSISLLTYLASSIFELGAIHEEIDEETLGEEISRLKFPINSHLNDSTFKVTLTNRRKSGRSLIYHFIIDSLSHKYEIFKDTGDTVVHEDESLLKDLTTFNLTTSSKQKLAKEQVELPFMQAQEALGSSGGAIVYEFEKDDDYDEEDPYEDPF